MDKYTAYREHQKNELKELRKYSPSVIRNSVLMWVIQIISLVGTFAGLCAIVYFAFVELEGYEQPVVLAVIISFTILMRVIHLFTQMIRFRNKYILRLEELIELK